MAKQKDETKRRINFVLDLTKPREKALADYLDNQFSITGTVKEAIEEKMLKDKFKIDITSKVTESIENDAQKDSLDVIENPNNIKDDEIDTTMMSGF